MWPPFCLTTSCKRTLAFITTFRHKSSESAQHNYTMWALSYTIFSGLLWNTFSFKNPHKKKLHGLISGLWGGHNLPPSWHSGNQCDITQRLNISYRKSRTTFAMCGWAPSCMNHCVCIGRPFAKRWGMKLVFQHVLVSFFGDGVMEEKWTNDSMGWNCGPHINFCSIIFFLTQCVRKFPRPESYVLFIDNTIHMKVGFVCKPCVVKYGLFFHCP